MASSGSYEQAIHGLTETWLRPYIERQTNLRPPVSRKELNDSIWGTIRLSALEVFILDSPLLQRLRYIRQLGVAHWVFPGATHSRLEHSLGSTHQVHLLADSLNLATSPHLLIDEPTRKLLRLTALCHDVGHGFMSHVSENALLSFESVEDTKLNFSDSHDIETVQLSELNAYHMLGSPAFRDLLDVAVELTNTHDLPNDPIDKMQRAIIGLPTTDRIPQLSELISGPFDADKLDYMTRDAQMCGVPVVTDIRRLIEKVRAVEVPEERLPVALARRVKGNLPSYWLIGVAISGGRTLDELMLGRTLLFDKIYQHQKVRAIESMIGSMAELIASTVTADEALFPLLFDDDELLRATRDVLEAKAGRALNEDELARVNLATDIGRRIRDRNLFSRAFAFSQNMPLDTYQYEPEQRRGLESLLRDAEALSQADLASKIVEETLRILQQLERSAILALFPANQLRYYVRVSGLSSSGEAGQISQAFLILPDDRIMRFREDSAESRGWSDAYLLTRELGLIFAPPELSPYVFLAAERVVREDYKVRMPPSMYVYAKQDAGTLDALRRELEEVGYYDAAPADLRPPPERLEKADMSQRMPTIVRRLSPFEGMTGKERERGKTAVDSRRVSDWLSQFRDDALIDSALTLVEHIRVIGRSDLVSALRSFFEANGNYENGSLCPFGSARDSSGIVGYYAEDVAKQYRCTVTSLERALSTAAPLVLIDDFVGSGDQAVSILEAWLGEEPTTQLHERRDALSEALAEQLRQTQIAILFSAGTEEGLERVRSRSAELGLETTVYAGATSDLPQAFGTGILGGAEEAAFREFCRNVGSALLLSPDEEHDEDWVRKRALGYGNDAYLLAFPYNVPTQTLTCIWESGEFKGVDWSPLLPRRKKT